MSITIKYNALFNDHAPQRTCDFEDVVLSTPKDEYTNDEQTLYDSDRPNAEYPRWLPQYRPIPKYRQFGVRIISFTAITIIIVAIARLAFHQTTHKLVSVPNFIMSKGQPHPPAPIEQIWTLEQLVLSKNNRSVILVNGKMPGPTIEARKDDEVTITLRNALPMAVSIHWHGLKQYRSNDQDGVPFLTQQLIQAGDQFVYSFIADSVGTFWWHAHVASARLDGLCGALIVHPRPYEADNGDSLSLSAVDTTDMVILAGDWYEHNPDTLLSDYLDAQNTALVEPMPSAIIVNGIIHDKTLSTNMSLPKIEPRTRYWRLRIVNIGAMAELKIKAPSKKDGFSVIEADAFAIMPVNVNALSISPGQRYSMILDTDDYAKDEDIYISFSLSLSSHHHTMPPNEHSYTHSHHHHRHHARSLPINAHNESSVKSSIELTDGMLHPLTTYPNISSVARQADYSVTTLTLGMRDVNGLTRSTINGRTFVPAKHTLIDDFAFLSLRNTSGLSNVYGADRLSLSIAQGESLLLLLVNKAGGNHPIHIHGHSMTVLATNSFFFDPGTQQSTSRPFAESSLSSILRAAREGSQLERPIARDTVNVAENGWSLVQITGQGKGLWSMHCHSVWHEMSGMAMILEVR